MRRLDALMEFTVEARDIAEATEMARVRCDDIEGCELFAVALQDENSSVDGDELIVRVCDDKELSE